MHKYNVPKIVAEIIRLKKQSNFKYNTSSEAIALTTVAIIIFQYFIFIIISNKYFRNAAHCTTKTTNSATKVPIAAPDAPNLGINTTFNNKSVIAPATSEYKTIFSFPNGTTQTYTINSPKC